MKRTSSALKKAAALFDQRLPVSSKEFLELSEALQAQSFTMAKVWNETFLDELQTSLAKAIESGMSFEAWYPKAQKLLASFGGKVKVAVQDEFGLMDPSYARLVFNVATEGAFAAARYSTMFSSARVESHPYVVYHTARDNRVRPAHRLLEGRVFDKNDASARRLLPPSDYNCRCWVTDLTAEEKSDGGYRLSKGSSFDRPPGDWNVDRVKALVPDTYKRTFRASAADEEYEGEFLKRIYLMAANQPRAPKGTHEVVFGRLALEASSVLARVEFANPYHEPKGSKKGGQFAHKGKGPMAGLQNARSLAAMKSYVPITASGLRTSKGNERALTAFLIGRGTMAWNSSDSEPIDIAVRSGRKWVGVELKSRLTATAHKRVNMSPPKRRRKEDWGAHPKSRRWGKEWPKMPLVTVAWDTVENTFYIEQHVGAFWYKGMKKHKTMASLRRAILKAAR